MFMVGSPMKKPVLAAARMKALSSVGESAAVSMAIAPAGPLATPSASMYRRDLKFLRPASSANL